MNTTTFMSPLLGTQNLSVGQYINSFGVFFSSIGLLTFDERDLPIVVLNALFRHLNNSNNETQAKIQLLEKALKENNLNKDRENTTLEIADVNKTFQYIITEALFPSNITGFVSDIVNIGNTSCANLKDNSRKYLSRLLISNNLCSSNNSSSKLTALAIDKLLDDFILPSFDRGTKKSSDDVQRENIPVPKRLKRQMNSSLNDAETYEAPNYMEFANDVQYVPQIFKNNGDYGSNIAEISKKVTIPSRKSFKTPKSDIMAIPDTFVPDNLDDGIVEVHDAIDSLANKKYYEDLSLSDIEDALGINNGSASDNDYDN